MSEPPTTSTPNSSAQLPQKPFWVGGPPQTRSGRSRKKGGTIKDRINDPSHGNVEPSKQNSPTLGSIDSATTSSSPANVPPVKTEGVKSFGSVPAMDWGKPIPFCGNQQAGPSSKKPSGYYYLPYLPPTILSPTVTTPVTPSLSEPESSTSKPNSPAPSSTAAPKPTKVDIRKLFQPSPSATLQTESDLLSYPTSLSTSTSSTQSAAPPSPQNPQNNVSTSNPRAGFLSDVPPTQSRPGASLAGGTGGDVGVGNKPPPTPRVPNSLFLTPALQESLNASITSGHFADTKVYLFSHRNAAGDICKPRALYANSIVLKSVPYFNDLFSGNYSEAATKDLGEDVAEEDAIAEHYDYYSDSDLEDAEDLEATWNSNDTNVTANGPQDAIRSDDHTSTYYEERMREGRMIKVQDVAFITFQAFLLYLYTGRIELAPFGSEDGRKTRATEIVSLAPDCVPRPSPKSIYRLADKYDVPALKSLAFDKIKEGLEQCDPVRETFSRFTSHHPEILGMHVENLATILTGFNSGEAQDRLDEQLQYFAEGEIGHASEAFSSLWRTLVQGRGRKTTCDTHLNTLETPPPAESSPLSMALIKSIRQGSFCDRRYLAKRDDSGKLYSPVYTTSAVLGDVERSLNTLIGDPESEAGDSGDDCDSDSDYEDTTDFIPEDTSHSKKKSEPTTAVTLSIGALSTWRALLFYLYTGRVQFAPLKSNGLETRAEYVKENLNPGNPPSCSPKSVCYLAGKLGLPHLENTALGDVIAKTSITNIVEETFSRSTARLPRIREVQCQLLLSSSRNEEIVNATEEHIHCLADGQTPHRYAALSLGFRMAIEAKRVTPSGKEGFSQRKNLDQNRKTQSTCCNHQKSVQIPAQTPETTPKTALQTEHILRCYNSGCPSRFLDVRGVRGRTVCQSCWWALRSG